MTIRKPLVIVSGVFSELRPGDTVEGVVLTTSLTAGSGLSGGGSLSTDQRVDISLASNPSGLIFVGTKLGIDGSALISGNAALVSAATAQASGNAALVSAATAQASGNAALVSAATAQASGNAALSGLGSYLPKSGGTLTGFVTFASGQVYPQIPANSQTTGYTFVVGDAGKHISITTGGVTVPSGIFAVGDVVSVYNNSGSNQTITQGTSVTLRQAGTASTGNRTLAQYGIATVLCVASNTFVITGTGLI